MYMFTINIIFSIITFKYVHVYLVLIICIVYKESCNHDISVSRFCNTYFLPFSLITLTMVWCTYNKCYSRTKYSVFIYHKSQKHIVIEDRESSIVTSRIVLVDHHHLVAVGQLVITRTVLVLGGRLEDTHVFKVMYRFRSVLYTYLVNQ